MNETGERTGWRRHLTKRNVLRAGLGLIGLLAVIQLIPYGRDHTNPPVTRTAHWADPKAKRLFADACGDCHSNLTHWYWYTSIAPGSWLAQNDIKGGREHLNVSEWDMPQPDFGDVSEQISSGEMPPIQYKLIHSKARLSDSEKKTLISGLQDLYAKDPPPIGNAGGG